MILAHGEPVTTRIVPLSPLLHLSPTKTARTLWKVSGLFPIGLTWLAGPTDGHVVSAGWIETQIVSQALPYPGSGADVILYRKKRAGRWFDDKIGVLRGGKVKRRNQKSLVPCMLNGSLGFLAEADERLKIKVVVFGQPIQLSITTKAQATLKG